MRWEGRRRSSNVEDRRGQPSRGGAGLKIGGGLGVIIVLIGGLVFGKDLRPLLGLLEGGTGGGQERASGAPPADDKEAQFISVILADTEDTWTRLFKERGRSYEKPKLVLFTDEVRSACGFQSAAVGPFYCPGDRDVYIDLSFFKDLASRFGAPGDFAQAYVVGHEVGHHVQNLLGSSRKVRQLKKGKSKAEKNALSVRLELQADCYSGVWAHYADKHRQMLEEGDVEEGLRAAAAIGDDTLQRRSRGKVSPESWTHGSSEQRVRWFKRGLKSGKVDDCDTLAVAEP